MADALASGTLLQDTYRIVRRIGAGGMGEVYEAAHARLPGRYAVKLLLPELASHVEAFARFRREAEITSSLRHPNIVQVLDFNKTPDGAPYLVMEYLEGADLATRLQETGPLPPLRVVEIAGEIASALAAAHAHGVVHRDLKPANVFLVPVAGQDKELVKVVDFGISKVIAATKNLTQQAAIMGTPQYMSPEQALGRVGEIDERTDQFALALLVYEMLAGRPAFDGDSLQAILYQVVHEQPGPLSVSSEVQAVIFRGIAKKRADRYPATLAFHRALTEAVGRTARARAPLPVTALAARAPSTAAGQTTTFSRTAGEIDAVRQAPARFAAFLRRHPRGALGGAAAALAIVVAGILAVAAPSGRRPPVIDPAAATRAPDLVGLAPRPEEVRVPQPPALTAPSVLPAALPTTPPAPKAADLALPAKERASSIEARPSKGAATAGHPGRRTPPPRALAAGRKATGIDPLAATSSPREKAGPWTDPFDNGKPDPCDTEIKAWKRSEEDATGVNAALCLAKYQRREEANSICNRMAFLDQGHQPVWLKKCREAAARR